MVKKRILFEQKDMVNKFSKEEFLIIPYFKNYYFLIKNESKSSNFEFYKRSYLNFEPIKSHTANIMFITITKIIYMLHTPLSKEIF